MVYLDNSSTTRQADEVTDLISGISRDHFGNPSSLHSIGLDAEKIVEKARRQLADAVGADPSEITFDSGGTEADNTVLLETAEKRKHDGKRIVISAVEHPAVMETADRLAREGFDVVKVGCGKADSDHPGSIDMEALREAVTEDTILVSVMAANNETGAVMPVREIAAAAHAKGAWMHTDAVQALGKMDLSHLSGGAEDSPDFITVSSHKIHGPKGVGMMTVRKGVKIPPFVTGGGQEKNLRSGTENVPGIAGFGLAAELACGDLERHCKKMAEARAYLLDGIKAEIPDILINTPDHSVPSVLNVCFLGTRGEVLLHTLEQDGIYVSTGSACSSNKKGKSYVLADLGRSDKEIESALRFSFSRYNTIEEMDFVIDRLKKAVSDFRMLGSFR